MGVSCSRLSSACRWASRASKSPTNCPLARASPSTTVTTPSTVAPVRISGQRKACTRGLGKANPEVSIRMQSRRSRRLSSSCIVGKNSSCTVQHKHPFASSQILVLGSSSSSPTRQDRNNSPSIPERKVTQICPALLKYDQIC